MESQALSSTEGNSRARTGQRGEDAAARFLAGKGCVIKERNWRVPTGEVDLVAECPSSNPGGETLTPHEAVLAFVEVRTRHGRTGLSEESITHRKAASMLAAAHAYLEAHSLNPDDVAWRIDLVAIAVVGETIKSINWVQGVLDEGLLGP